MVTYNISSVGHWNSVSKHSRGMVEVLPKVAYRMFSSVTNGILNGNKLDLKNIDFLLNRKSRGKQFIRLPN
jgi:hypothetical protein